MKKMKMIAIGAGVSILSTSIVPTYIQTTHFAQAAKNKDGVCEIETKSGEFNFNANGQEISTEKPVDLFAILDGSPSFTSRGKFDKALADLTDLVKSLPEKSHVIFSTYLENNKESYLANKTQGVTKLLSKEEALDFLEKVKNYWINDPQGYLRLRSPFVLDKTDSGFLSDANDLGTAKYLNTQSFNNIEDVYDTYSNKNETLSVVQFTDEWEPNENIDTTFVEWAKKNAKTFMSVLYYTENLRDTKSETSMKEANHPNIYRSYGVDDSERSKKIIEQFKNTGLEKTQPKVNINVTPEQGITLKEVKLVNPDGQEENLEISDNKVNVEKDLPKDGNWTVKVKADGLVPENRKVTATASIAGKEVGKTEIEFEGCKDDVKPTVTKRIEKLPFKTQRVEDNTLKEGEEKVVVKGEEGEKEITTTVTPASQGQESKTEVTEKVIKEPVDEVIHVGVLGSKEETENVDIPFETIYEDTDTLPEGETQVKQEGVVGVKQIKKVWKTIKGEKDGDPTVTESVTKEKVDKIVLRGTQQKRTVYYRIVDAAGKVLQDKTKVSDGYKDAEYSVTKPVLAGYEIELKEGMKESGKIANEDVVVDYVAYKIGQDVTLKYVADGKDIKDSEVISQGKRVGTKFEKEVEKEITTKDGVLYRFVGLELENADKSKSKPEINGTKVSGEVNDTKQAYVAKYEMVKSKPVIVAFVDEEGKELQAKQNLIKEDQKLGTEYNFKPKAIEKDGVKYTVEKITLGDKEVKEIKGKSSEEAAEYTVHYKKVPEKVLPKTSAAEQGMTLLGLLMTLASVFGFRRLK